MSSEQEIDETGVVEQTTEQEIDETGVVEQTTKQKKLKIKKVKDKKKTCFS